MKKVVLSLLIMLVLSELLLRAFGALYLSASGRGDAGGGPGGIVCVGDSATFGLYLSAEESYPARLGALVERHASSGLTVHNLGIPGMSAGHVARDLPGHIERHEPRVVVVLCGLNNSWSGGYEPESTVGRFFADLRLVKVARLLIASVGGDDSDTGPTPGPMPGPGAHVPDAAAEFEDTDGVVDLLEHRSRGVQTPDGRLYHLRNRDGEEVVFLQENNRLEGRDFLDAVRGELERMADCCRGQDVPLVLLTYPFDNPNMRKVNAVVRDVAGDLGSGRGVLLVDLERSLRPYVEQRGLEALAFPDFHPRAEGTELMAHEIYAALREAGIVAGEPAPLPAARGAEPERERTFAWDGQAFLITGPRGEAVRIVLSPRQGTTEREGIRIPLDHDVLLDASWRDRSLWGGIGPDGELVLEPRAETLQRLDAGALHAAALFGNQNRRADVYAVLGPVELRP